MNSLAKVLPHHVQPVENGVPGECPRCGQHLDGALREVNLVLTLDDGAELDVVGHECAACGWCCAPDLL
jgi:hypothetical protein